MNPTLQQQFRTARLLFAAAAIAAFPSEATVTWEELAGQTAPPAQRIAYGNDARQFGELRLPEDGDRHPVAIVIHGGCWQSKFDYRHITGASAALTRSGVATWTIEYRRIGDPGGGWPGTFDDVAAAADYLRTLAVPHSLDLTRLIALGHSAGGQLALWLAGRAKLPPTSTNYTANPLSLRGVVALAGISDLRKFGSGPEDCNKAVAAFLGGKPASVPDRYAQTSPIELLPLGVPQILVHGTQDRVVSVEQSRRFAARAQTAGDESKLWAANGAGHFDVIAPSSPAWPTVEQAVFNALGTHRF